MRSVCSVFGITSYRHVASPTSAPVSSSCKSAVTLFFTHAGCPCTSTASRCLLTLKTKHMILRFYSIASFLICEFLPSIEIVTTFHGMNCPLFFNAVTAACSSPPQTRHFHSNDRHALDIIISDDLRQLFTVIHVI